MDWPLKLGTRGSPLALAQAREAAARIVAANGWDDDAIAIVPVTTTGDKVQDRALSEIGGKALWTKELDRALDDGIVDFCVHSMKDVESERQDHFIIAAILPRADVRDRLIGARTVEELRREAVVGTSSPRRAAQLRRLRPDISTITFRGNVQTRLAKVEAGEVDATLLAAAGLDRLNIDIGSPMDTATVLPAPGQAAVGIECRRADADIIAALEAANHADSFDCVSAERAFTRALGGTCHSPVAALATVTDDNTLDLVAQLFSEDGSDCLSDSANLARGDLALAEALARSMLDRAGPSIRRLFEAA